MKLQDVAKKLGVSAATVSRALNPATRHLISGEVRDRIEKYALKNRFTPNRAGRELSTGRTHAMGLLLPTTFDSFFFNDHMTKVLAAVDKVLSKRPRYALKLIVVPKGGVISELDQRVMETGIDGLLLSSCSDHGLNTSHYLPERMLAKWDKPVVVIGMQLHKKWGFSYFHASNEEAAKRATTYLIRKGRRRIAFINQVPAVPDSNERLAGYKAALKEHQIGVDASLIIETAFNRQEAQVFQPALLNEPGHNLYPVERAYKVGLELLKPKGPKPDAVFCANDETAIGILRAVRVLGLRCPQDVAVMGFDGIAAGELTDPRLSTVSQPTYEMAEKGTNLLLDLIEGKVKGAVNQQIPMPLVIRDSA